MKHTPIIMQVLLPVTTFVILLAFTIIIAGTYILRTYESQAVADRSLQAAEIVSDDVHTFTSGAYNLTASLAGTPSIHSMDPGQIIPVFQATANVNDYMELLYIQDMNGDQLARSPGFPGNRKTRWWFTQMVSSNTNRVNSNLDELFTAVESVRPLQDELGSWWRPSSRRRTTSTACPRRTGPPSPQTLTKSASSWMT